MAITSSFAAWAIRMADIVPVLKSFDTPFNPETIHASFAGEYKEFKTGRRYPWAADRVM